MNKTRIIFFAGKGGVGKTTTAAATAIRSAQNGYRTLIMSTDPAHSLADTFECLINRNVTAIRPNLDAFEIDPYFELDSNWGEIRDYLSSLIISLGADASLAGELATIPGMDNLFSLLRIREFHQSQQYDVIIVDMAPTGESLRLLSLPDAISLALKVTRYLEKYLVSPVIRPASKMSKSLRAVIAPEEVAKSWETLLEKLLDVRKILEADTVTSTRLVLNPEKMVINESQRALTYLNLFGITVDCIIVNRLIPDAVQDSYFHDWYSLQQRHLKNVYELFSPLPIKTVPFFKEEVIGIAKLNLLAECLYDNDDPTHLFYSERPVKIIVTKEERIFAVQAPFIKPGLIELSTRGNELMIQIGNQLRSFIIPDSLSGLSPTNAVYTDGWIHVKFQKN
ncbi:ArsA family ATPase [bacterium]|nr:ArsA family ATPase [bacterium]